MRTLYTLLGGFAVVAVSLHGQVPKPAAPSPTPQAPAREIVLTGLTVNVKESGTPVTIRLFRWSTDEERAALIAAFNAPAAARPGGGGRAGAPAGTRQGQAQRGQGQSQSQAREQPNGQDKNDPQAQDEPSPQGRGQGQPSQAQAGQGRGQGQAGQGQAQGAGRGGRGGAPPTTASSPFMQAIQ